MRRYLKDMVALSGSVLLIFNVWSSAIAEAQKQEKPDMDTLWRDCFENQGVAPDPEIFVPKIYSIYPDVLPDQEDPPYLSVLLSSPVYKFKTGAGKNEESKVLKACYSWGENHVEAINIRSIEHSPSGRTATIRLDLPNESSSSPGRASSIGFPWFEECPRCQVELMIISDDKMYSARGSFHFVSRSWAFVAATLITFVAAYGLKQLRRYQSDKGEGEPDTKAWWMGLIIGQDGQPSLSLFQIIIWTILTVWSLLFVAFNTGNLMTMTEQVMILLGFAGVGSLTARWIASRRQLSTTSPANEADPPRFWAMLEADGKVDLFKVQLLLFTVLIAGYVAFRIVRQSAFPELDPQFLLLMGISNGLYVGTKFTQTSPLAIAGARKIELDALLIEQKNLEAKHTDLTAQLQEINAKVSDAAIDQTPSLKDQLMSKKRLIEKESEDCKDALAKVVTAIETKTNEYKKALEAATQT